MVIDRPFRVLFLFGTLDISVGAEQRAIQELGMTVDVVGTDLQILDACSMGLVDCVVIEPTSSFPINLIRTIKSDPHTDVPIIAMLPPQARHLESQLINSQVDDVLPAPWEHDSFALRVQRLCTQHHHRLAMTGPLDVMRSIAKAVEKHDPYTSGHIERLRFLAGHVAFHMGLTARDIAVVRAAGLLHDIGKIAIPGEILRKPDKLSAIEWELMRLHPAHGADIVASMPNGDLLAPMVRAHHERWDGKGYPDKLGESDIPLGGRIISVVDAFDAMTTNRPYRAAMPIWDARERVIAGSGSQFDPNVVEALLSMSPTMLQRRFA